MTLRQRRIRPRKGSSASRPDPRASTHGPIALRRLPLGSIQPGGWLAEQLRLQAAGLTGSLEEIWPDVGPDSAWLGGAGEDWERGPYYLDGLVPLAHLLGDERLLSKASHWVEHILGSQRPDGWFGPATNDDWWPRMVALKALIQHAEATGDERVPPFLARYFRHQLAALPSRPLVEWGRVRGAENLLAVTWLFERARDPWLLELADLLVRQTADWGPYLAALPARGITRTWDHMTHVVNVAMGLKTPAARYLLDLDPRHRGQTAQALAQLDRYHGQVHGMFSGDEWLAGPAPTRGVELCAVVELLFSLQQMLVAWGEPDHADRLERIGYNLLPAALTAEMTAHQYHQQANQVLVTIDQRDWTQAGDDCTVFGLEPNFGCCTANLHQGWPKLAAALWMGTSDEGIAAVIHGPSTLRWSRDGRDVAIKNVTDYPFGETLEYTVRVSPPTSFPLYLRLPGWCSHPELRLNGSPLQLEASSGYLTLDREWSDGDRIDLRFPMEVRPIRRRGGAVGITLGPLVLAFSPGEIWQQLPGSAAFGDWEVRPRRSWNFALAVDARTVASVARVERFGPSSPPFGLRTGAPPVGIDGVPLKVWVPACRLPGWGLERNSAAATPSGSQATTDRIQQIPLVPYGSARIRVAEFPTVGAARATGSAGDDPAA